MLHLAVPIQILFTKLVKPPLFKLIYTPGNVENSLII